MEPDVEIAVLRREIASVRREMRDHTELLDTLATPPWKRVWFFLRGYRLWRLGVWYRAVWNADAHGNEDRRRWGMGPR